MKLTFRFLILVGTLLLAVGASTLAGWQAISSLDAALARAVDNDMQRLLSITHARRAFRSMTLSERDHILAEGAAERDALAKKIAALGVELGSHLAHYSARMPDEDRPAIAAIQGVRQRWLELNRRVVAVADEDRKLALELSQQHHADPISWEAAIGELVKLSEKRLSAQVQHTHQIARTARFTLIGVAGLAAALAAALGSVIFGTMRRNLDELVALNADLEQRVQQRTVALAARERALRIVLDSTGDGLITVSLQGKVAGECSAAALTWFGEPRPDQSIWEFLLPHSPPQQLGFQVAFEQLAEDLMPWDVSAAQMPRLIELDGHSFELHFLRIHENGSLARILVRAQDVTARMRSEQAERASREQQTLIAHLLRDKPGFMQFVQECEGLFSRLREDAPALELARNLHTLKGNAGLFGLQSIVDGLPRSRGALDRMRQSPSLGRDHGPVGAVARQVQEHGRLLVVRGERRAGGRAPRARQSRSRLARASRLRRAAPTRGALDVATHGGAAAAPDHPNRLPITALGQIDRGSNPR